MAQGTGFQGTYKVTSKPREQVEAGKWYYWLHLSQMQSALRRVWWQ